MAGNEVDTAHSDPDRSAATRLAASESASRTTIADVSLDKLTRAFEVSARRWELIVYPSIVAFGIMSSYAFYLIYHMVGGVQRLATQMLTVERTMNIVSDSMVRVTDNMASITADMRTITEEMQTMRKEAVLMRQNFDEALIIATRMDEKMAVVVPVSQRMLFTAEVMTDRMQSVTRPMNFMTSLFPMGR